MMPPESQSLCEGYFVLERVVVCCLCKPPPHLGETHRLVRQGREDQRGDDLVFVYYTVCEERSSHSEWFPVCLRYIFGVGFCPKTPTTKLTFAWHSCGPARTSDENVLTPHSSGAARL
jgi:hypothetical protein